MLLHGIIPLDRRSRLLSSKGSASTSKQYECQVEDDFHDLPPDALRKKSTSTRSHPTPRGFLLFARRTNTPLVSPPLRIVDSNPEAIKADDSLGHCSDRSDKQYLQYTAIVLLVRTAKSSTDRPNLL